MKIKNKIRKYENKIRIKYASATTRAHRCIETYIVKG